MRQAPQRAKTFEEVFRDELAQKRRIAKAGSVGGRHYTEWVETVKQLKRDGKLREAEELLIECDHAADREAEIQECEKAPWYEEQLAIVRRKMARASKKIGSKG